MVPDSTVPLEDNLNDRRSEERRRANGSFRWWVLRVAIAFFILVAMSGGGLYYTYRVAQNNHRDSARAAKRLDYVVRHNSWNVCTRGNELRFLIANSLSGAVRAAVGPPAVDPDARRARAGIISRTQTGIDRIRKTAIPCGPEPRP